MIEAFEALEAAGYHIGSAYTAVKDPAKTKFVYRDRLWEGRGPRRPRRGVVRPRQRRPPAEPRYLGDLLRRDRTRRAAARPRLPADARRAHDSRVRPAAETRLGPSAGLPDRSTASTSSSASRPALASLRIGRVARLRVSPSASRSRGTGLLRVDVLLPRFFLPEHAGIRYT